MLNKRSKRIEAERKKAEAKVRECEHRFNIGSMIAKLKEDPKENEASMKGPKPTLKSTPVPVAAPVLNLDGSSILKDKDKKKIGMLQSDGTLVDLKGKPFGKASLETGKITDGANMLLAWFKVMVSSKPQKKSCFGTIELSIQLDRRF